MAVPILSRFTGHGAAGDVAEASTAPPGGGTPPPPGAADPDARGFTSVANELKGTPKRGRGRPRGAKSKTHRAQAPGAGKPVSEDHPGGGEERAEAGAGCDRFLTSGIPRLVARIYSRGVDIIALTVLAGMHVPANFYVRVSVDADAELWAETAIRHSFEVAPERAEQIWRAVAMYGLPLLHVGDGVLAARDRFLAELAARGPRA